MRIVRRGRMRPLAAFLAAATTAAAVWLGGPGPASRAEAAGAQTDTVVLRPVASGAFGAQGVVTATAPAGDGAWTVHLSPGVSKFELYIDPSQTPLGTFTVGDIASISYKTKGFPSTGTPVDFSLYIYTEPGDDENANDAPWYGHRLTAEPRFAKQRNADPASWNTWTTDAGTNQLIFYDTKHGSNGDYYGSYTDPTLQTIQAGSVDWAVYSGQTTDIDYASQTVKFISLQTGSAWSAGFQGQVDDLEVALKDGTTVVFDLEPPDEVWVDPGYTTSNSGGHVFGVDAFASIQEALDTVDSGGTVHIAAGSYTGRVAVTRPVAIVGDPQDPGSVVITSSQTNGTATVELSADGVTLQGVTVSNEGEGPAVSTSADRSGYHILDNVLRDSTFGLYLNSDGADETVVSGNTFENNNRVGSASGDGIYSDQGLGDARIEGNTFTGHKMAAIVLTTAHQGQTVEDVTIVGNQLDNSIAIFNASDVMIAGNVRTPETAASTAGSGVFIGGGTSNVVIEGNVWQGSANGIFIDDWVGAPNSGVVIQANSIVADAAHLGLFVADDAHGGPVVATFNWWGCPEWPGAAGCSAVSGAVVTEPWLTGLDVQLLSGGNGTLAGQPTVVEPVVRTSSSSHALTAADVADYGLALQYQVSGQGWTNVDTQSGQVALTRFAAGSLTLDLRLVNARGGVLLQSAGTTFTWVAPPAPPTVVLGSTTVTVAEGGATEVSSSDGLLALTLPEGGAPAGSTVTVAPLAPGEEPAPGTGMVMIAGHVYQIEVEDADGNPVTSFDQPIHLSFTVDPSELPEGTDLSSLQIFYWDEPLGVWVPVPSTVDPATGTVSADVTHLTVFTVAVATGATAHVPPDVVGHWAERDVLRLVALGAVTGYADGTFQPDADVTRAEFVKMLVGALGLPLADASAAQEALAAFADAGSIPEWAAPYVAAALDAGLVNGYEDGTFRPDALVTRAEVAAIVARALGEGAPEGSLGFTDAATIPDWALPGVEAAVGAGIVSGYPDGTFRPAEHATRAQVAAMIVRLLEWRAAQ